MEHEQTLQPEQPSQLGNWVFIIVSALLCFGALMVFSAGATVDREFKLSEFWKYATIRRILFVPLCWMVIGVVSKFNYRLWCVNRKFFLFSPIVLLQLLAIALLVLVLLFGKEENNARRWFKIALAGIEISFQPSELAKWITVMFLAVFAAWRGDGMKKFFSGFLPATFVLLLVVGLIGKEDFGTAVLVAAIGIFIILLGGARWWYVPLTFAPAIAGAFYFLVYKVPYRMERVMEFLQKTTGDGQAQQQWSHASQSIMAIGSGGLWGAGLGRGTIKLGYVPEDTTDFIFAVIGEELGFAGCALLIGLFLIFLILAMIIVRKCPDPAGKLLGIAVAGTIGAQALMNLMVVTGLAPTKGIALPFISAGGSGLLVMGFAVGVLINIANSLPSPQPDLENNK